MIVESVFNCLLTELDDKFAGLDQCFSKLHEVIKRFVKSRKGGSAVVIGPKSSGKRSIISKVVMDYADDMEVIFIDGLVVTSDTDALKIFDESETNSSQLQFVIIFNFDQFIRRGRQTLLYTLLNASRSGSVFVLCVSSRQASLTNLTALIPLSGSASFYDKADCTELLEKRVRSRLSNSIISFTQSSMSFEDFSKAFETFLHTNVKEHEQNNDLIQAFIADDCVERKLREIYDETRSYCILKQITATFLCFMDAEHIESLASSHASRIFTEAKNAVIANEDTMKSIILSLTLRQLCLLLCCVRLVRYRRRQDFTFREIILDYRNLVNKYLPTLNVKDDLILLKELDTLCSLTVLEERDHCGQLLFKRTSLQVDIDLVLNCVKEFTPFPTALMQWIDDFKR
ncbi:Origin recognition complex subunit 4 [Dirofilaria immitis]|nr:Origin recognition complex subunit 4 [Dirofilaria immitis]